MLEVEYGRFNILRLVLIYFLVILENNWFLLYCLVIVLIDFGVFVVVGLNYGFVFKF